MGMVFCREYDASIDALTDVQLDVPLDVPSMDVGLDAAERPGAREICSARTNRTLRCGDLPEPFDECVDVESCRLATVRDDVRMFVPACIDGLECSADERSCFVPERLGLVSTSAAEMFAMDCRAALAGCAHDVCDVAGRTDDAIDELEACLDPSLTCSSSRECLSACP